VELFVPELMSTPLNSGVHGPGTGDAKRTDPALIRKATSNRWPNLDLKRLPVNCGGRVVLVSTVLIIITVNWVLGVSGVEAVVINFGEGDVAIDEADNALGIAVERHVSFSGFASVPGERGVSRPLHRQEGAGRMLDGGDLPTGKVGNVFHGNTVENVAAVIKSRAEAEWLRVRIPAVLRTGKDFVLRGRRTCQTDIPFYFFLVPPPEALLVAGRNGRQSLIVIVAECENGAVDLLQVGGATGEPGVVANSISSRHDERGNYRDHCKNDQQVCQGKRGQTLAAAPGARVRTRAGKSAWNGPSRPIFLSRLQIIE
jgi:hypothetical protein